MIYSKQALADEISKLLFDEDIIILHNHEFEFDNASVKAIGYIHGTFERDDGDYYQPPTCDLISYVTDIHEVVVCYEDCEVKLNIREIEELENLIEL